MDTPRTTYVAEHCNEKRLTARNAQVWNACLRTTGLCCCRLHCMCTPGGYLHTVVCVFMLLQTLRCPIHAQQ
eukprot:1143653-Pelagomonas_calceolata.AAC.3